MLGRSRLQSRRIGSLGGPPAVQSTSIDPTGLILTATFTRPVTAGSGSATATADGVAITLGTPTYSGNTVTWGVTNGNPSGNPVLSGAVVQLTLPAGVVVSGGQGNVTAVVGVTNGSGVTAARLVLGGKP